MFDLDPVPAHPHEDDTPPTPQILFCSRTHSQLSQIISEVRQTSYSEDLRVVSLGSRMNLCVNEAVKKLGTLNRINDKCLDLQKGEQIQIIKVFIYTNNHN